MFLLNASLHPSRHLLQWGRVEGSKALQVDVKPITRVPSSSNVWKVRTRCFQGLRKINWITNRSDESFKGKCFCVGFEAGNESKSEENNDSTRFQSFIWKKLNAFYTFIRPFSVYGALTLAISSGVLPVQTIEDLSPALVVGILKALVPAFFITIYSAGVNQLWDVDIDKINKPYLPLASGEFSMEAGIAITSAAAAMGLVTAIMSSPPLFIGVFIHFLTASAYSIDVPLLRWKKHTLLEATSMVMLFLSQQFGHFIHIQKHVLGKPLAITKSLVVSTIICCIFVVAAALFKDIPDLEGDKAFGIQTLAVKLGKENVFWLCVKMLLIAYGFAMLVGATSASLLSRLVTISGHFLLAAFLLFRAQSIDLTSNTSIASFYSTIWKLISAECFLTPFVR